MKIQNWVKKANDWFNSHNFMESDTIGWRQEFGALIPYIKNSVTGGGGSSTPCVIPALIVSQDGAFYNVTLWANGYGSAQTGTGVTDILMLNYASTLPAGTKVGVFSNYVIETGGG